MPAVADADLEFDCPRCARPVAERFYGPCAACRRDLAALFATAVPEAEDAGGAAAPSRFEPGLHVVPNHVATKD